MTYPTFPAGLPNLGVIEWDLLGGQIGPGSQPSGISIPIRTSIGGLWVASGEWTLISIDHIRAFRTLRILANGGASPIIVPRTDVLPSSTTRTAQAVGGAALSAEEMIINITAGLSLGGGEHFAIDHPTLNWRLYEIGSVEINGDGHYVISFNPPLREAVSDATAIEFQNPRCLMRAVAPNALDHKMDAPWISTQAMQFVEHFD